MLRKKKIKLDIMPSVPPCRCQPVGNCIGILVPTCTLTHDPHRFTCQNASKNVENGREMAEMHLISMIFTKLAISHSILYQKICSWTRFVGGGYGNPYPYPDPSVHKQISWVIFLSKIPLTRTTGTGFSGV